jgi:hypothetical protein
LGLLVLDENTGRQAAHGTQTGGTRSVGSEPEGRCGHGDTMECVPSSTLSQWRPSKQAQSRRSTPFGNTDLLL